LDDKRTVRVGAFELDVTEVTVAAYQACVEAGRCTPRSTATIARYSEHCNGASRTKLRHPMNCVDWSDASRFCAAQGKRLPTAEEWQYAAASGDDRKFPWGSESPTAELLNACGAECTDGGLYRESDGYPHAAPVGSFPAGRTGYGLLDLGGNLREWTQGEPLLKKASTSMSLEQGSDCHDKTQPCRLQKAMGSDYGSHMVEHAMIDSSTWLLVDYRDPRTGFRCARTLAE
jgi:formylglycine-generating enzyme required for sulfatase activity